MNKLTEKRLDKFRRQDRMQAGSLIISLYGDAIYPRGAGAWLGCLIQLLSPLGISERLVRTAMYRLVKEGWLITQTHGRRTDYTLSTDGIQRIKQASKAIYAIQSPPWDQHWRLLMLDASITQANKERLRKALIWQGFGQWQSLVFVHPGADLQVALGLLEREGLGHLQHLVWPLTAQTLARNPGVSNKQIAASSWDLKQLANSYKQFVKTYQALMDEWTEVPTGSADRQNENAFLLRLLLIHDYRRLLLRDPGLPLSLLPEQWPGQVARELCAQLYKNLSVPSETYLKENLYLADGRLTTSQSLFKNRFRLC